MSLLQPKEERILSKVFYEILAKLGFQPNALGDTGMGALLNTLDPLPDFENGKILGVVDGELAWVDDQLALASPTRVGIAESS